MRLDTSPNPPRMGKESKWPEQRAPFPASWRGKNFSRPENRKEPGRWGNLPFLGDGKSWSAQVVSQHPPEFARGELFSFT